MRGRPAAQRQNFTGLTTAHVKSHLMKDPLKTNLMSDVPIIGNSANKLVILSFYCRLVEGGNGLAIVQYDYSVYISLFISTTSSHFLPQK